MTTGIVLSAYNGSKYIVQQLDSIKNQSVKADKVIISDDCSTDDTPSIIEAYIKDNNLTDWTFIKNSVNKGWKKNFYDLIDMCDTDWVLPCDQDDIWNNRKIEFMSRFYEDPKVNVIGGNYIAFSHAQSPVFDEVKGTVKGEHKGFGPKFNYVVIPGCCMGIRKTFFDGIKPYYFADLAHDEFAYTFGFLSDGICLVNQNLILHRLHDTVTAPDYTEEKTVWPERNLRKMQNMLTYLEVNPASDPDGKKADVVKRGMDWVEARKRLYKSGSFKDFMALLSYLPYYLHLRTWVREWLVAKR